MEWTEPRQFDESAHQRVERIGFDMLRAIASARQSATPTARAVQDKVMTQTVHGADSAELAGPMQTLSGLTVQYGGAFHTAPQVGGHPAPSRDKEA